jgi:GNAT superfamily N-acetyltransferase
VTTTPQLYLRTAVIDDVDLIFQWRWETAAWLAAAYGTDQWSTPYPRERIVGWVEQGATVMASLDPDGDPVATLTSSPDGDPALWTPAELAIPARYLFKANVTTPARGRGIGACLIAWAIGRAADAGAAVVRIDVWSTNGRLQDYYGRRGFRYLRTVGGTTSGALFEAPATHVEGLPIVVADDVQVA